MGAEDFSYMLNARPGAFIFVGNGDSAGLHHPAYDFNDEVIPIGIVVLGAAGRDGAAAPESKRCASGPLLASAFAIERYCTVSAAARRGGLRRSRRARCGSSCDAAPRASQLAARTRSR